MSIYEKLFELQKIAEAISKDSTNPYYKSKYFDINKLLDIVKPELNAKGLLLLQPLSHIDGKPAIKTILIEAETGETIEEVTPLTINPDPQKMGSAITYYRRYSLQSLLGLQAEDDDANKASTQKVEPKKEKPIPTKQIQQEISEMLKDMKNDAVPGYEVADDIKKLIKKELGVSMVAECQERDKLDKFYNKIDCDFEHEKLEIMMGQKGMDESQRYEFAHKHLNMPIKECYDMKKLKALRLKIVGLN